MKRIVWTDQARIDVRSLSKPTAMHILSALHRFAESGAGDVKALLGREELRPRISDYRVLFGLSRYQYHRDSSHSSSRQSLSLS